VDILISVIHFSYVFHTMSKTNEHYKNVSTLSLSRGLKKEYKLYLDETLMMLQRYNKKRKIHTYIINILFCIYKFYIS